MQNLTITLVQADLIWQNPVANRQHLEQQLEQLRGQTDLIVLPEMFTTGFTMAPELIAEPAEGPTLEWLLRQAQRLQAALTGSVAVASGGQYFNRLYWVQPDGLTHTYDKRHQFRMAGEQDHYRAGEVPLLIEWRGWRICPLICYDLRFPVWSRRRAGLDYHLLLYVANWPKVRRYPWQVLLKARAIENLSFCVGVNRVGIDGLGYEHSGDSAVLDFKGQVLLEAPDQEWLGSVILDHAALSEFRRKFPAHLDADGFALS
jgi:omega-amidase